MNLLTSAGHRNVVGGDSSGGSPAMGRQREKGKRGSGGEGFE